MNSIPGALRRRGPVAMIIALVLIASEAAAQAQPAPASVAPSSEARAHFERAVTFYDETDYSAALVEFQRAYALAPAWQVLFNIGQSYFQVRNYAAALVTLKRFIDEGQERIPPERRALVDGECADLANRVGHARITSNEAGATISIDDVEVGATPLGEDPLVSVGVRKVKAVRPGSAPVEKEVSVPAGETVEVRLDFAESPAPPPPPSVAIPPPNVRATSPAPSPSVNRTPAFVAFGVAIAGAAVGAVFGELTLRDKSRLEGECTGKACGPGSQPDVDAVSRDGTVSTVAFGVAAASAVAGVVLWITEGGATSRARDSVASAPEVTPLRFGPGFVAGSF